jgi:hypothetical protein
MNTLIDIHDHSIGTFSIWFKHNGGTHCIVMSESETDSLLTLRQKENFFIGKRKFKISQYDFKKIIEKIK